MKSCRIGGCLPEEDTDVFIINKKPIVTYICKTIKRCINTILINIVVCVKRSIIKNFYCSIYCNIRILIFTISSTILTQIII